MCAVLFRFGGRLSASASAAPLGALLGGHPANTQPFLPSFRPPFFPADAPLATSEGFWPAALRDLQLREPGIRQWRARWLGADLVAMGQERLVLQLWTERLSPNDRQRLCEKASEPVTTACARALALPRAAMEVQMRVAHGAGLEPTAQIVAMSRKVFEAALRRQPQVRWRCEPAQPRRAPESMTSAADLAEVRIALAGRRVLRVPSLIEFQLADQRALLALQALTQPGSGVDEVVVGGDEPGSAMVDLDALRRRDGLLGQQLSAPPLSACFRAGPVQ